MYRFLRRAFFVISGLLLSGGVAYAQTPPPSSADTATPPPTTQTVPHDQPQPAPGGQFPSLDPRMQQPSQFPHDPNFPGPNFQGQGGFPGSHDGSMQMQGRPDMRMGDHGMNPEQMEQQMEQRQKEQQQRMLGDMQRGSKQMERQLVMIERRLAGLKKKGAIIPADVQGAIDQIKTLVEKMKSATTPEDMETLMGGDHDFGDLMQTINEGMQKAEMSTQFPRMLKEANRMLKQQQSSLARAQARAKNMKINVDAVLAGWQKSVEAIATAITEAQQASQNNPEDAMDILKDRVFDAFQEIGDWQQTFGMVSNSQQMLKQADREMAKVDKQIARLKRQKEDTAELESVVAEARAKIAEIRDILVQPSIDSEALIRAIEEGQDIKEELYAVLFNLTGQQFGQGPQQIPGLQFRPMEPPKGLGQFFRDSDHEKFKETCRVDALGADMPGNCQEVQSMFENRSMPGGPMPQPSNQGPGSSGVQGPQSLKKAMEDLSPSLRASVVEAFRKYIGIQLMKK